MGNETAHQSGGWNTPPPPIPARWTAGDGGSIRGTASAFHAPWLPPPAPSTPQKRRQRGSGGSAVLPSAGFGSRFGRYRHLPPSPRAKRGQYLSARGFSFLGVFGCSKQGQPDALKAAGLCRACWVFLERILDGTRFHRAGRVEICRALGGDMPGFGWRYAGAW